VLNLRDFAENHARLTSCG